MKLVEVIFKGRDKFSKSSAKALRGYFGNFFKNIVEFHNHLDQITFNYKSPNIQYRVIDGNLSILGINEGGDILLKSIEEIKSSKRSLYRNRYEMLDKIAEEIRKTINK